MSKKDEEGVIQGALTNGRGMDILNANYTVTYSPNISKIIKHFTSKPTLNEDFLSTISILFSKQNPLSQDEHILVHLEACLEYLLFYAAQENSLNIINQILKTLAVISFENGVKLLKYHKTIVETLEPHLKNSASDQGSLTLKRMAINVFGNLCVKTGVKNGQNLHKDVYNLLLALILSSLSTQNEERGWLLFSDTKIGNEHIKVISSAFRALQILINENKNIVSPDTLTSLLTALQCYSTPQFTPYHGSNSADRHVHRFNSTIMSSDSEFDNDDTHNKIIPRHRLKLFKLQQTALSCLSSLISINPKQIYSNWSLFLPTDTTSSSLISLIKYHELNAVKIQSCSVLSAMVDGSKLYLNVAEDSRLKTSFTSLSQKIADQVIFMHIGVSEAIKNETDEHVLIAQVKFLNILCKNCNYARLSKRNLRQYMFDCVWPLFFSTQDLQLKKYILGLLSALIETAFDISKAINTYTKQTGGIIDLVLNLLGKQEALVDIACLDLLSCLCKYQLDDVTSNWERISKILRIYLSDTGPDKDLSRTATLKVIEQYALFCSNKYFGIDVVVDDEEVVQKSMAWWNDTLHLILYQTYTDTAFAVRSLSCDCLSHIPDHIFNILPDRIRNTCLSLTIGMLQDNDSNVIASACKTLGVFISHRCMKSDTSFICDVAMTIKEFVYHSNLTVRIRASWALGNLCDMLGDVIDNTTLKELGISEELLTEIVTVGIYASKDNDKCKSNGVRALGNIIKVCPELFLLHAKETIVKDVVLSVVKNVDSGAVKTRWNSCHALELMIRSPHFPISPSTSWTLKIYDVLIKVLVSSKNFKVRINAASCLQAFGQCDSIWEGGFFIRDIDKKIDFDDMIFYCLDTILNAMKGINDVAEFGEARYKVQFSAQLKNAFSAFSSRVSEGNKKRGNEIKVVFDLLCLELDEGSN